MTRARGSLPRRRPSTASRAPHWPGRCAGRVPSPRSAAREVARGVGEDADHEDPVEGARAVEQPMLDPAAQEQGGPQEHQGEAGLDQRGHLQRVALKTPCAAVGDRPREELLDGPVDHRQDHEHDRPAQRDASVGVPVQHMAGGRQVGEREDSRRSDPDRKHARAGGVGAAAGRRAALRSVEVVLVFGRERATESGAPPGLRASTHPHQQHRPREWRARLDDLAVAGQQAHESAPRPVVDVARRVARFAQICPPGDIRRPPERFAWNRHQQVAAGDPSHLGEGQLRVRDVFERLDRGDEIELVGAEIQLPSPDRAELEVLPAPRRPLGLQFRVLEVDADDPRLPTRCAHRAVSTPFATADVEDRARGRLREQPIEGELESAHQPPHERVLRPVLVERVARRDRLSPVGDPVREAHTSRASRSGCSGVPPGSL